ncbi:MAG: hypothetical protein ACRDNS_01155 [Trebonia sp.]
MLRMAWRALAHARGRAVGLAAGMLVAAVAFALLTAAVDVNSARITGAVAANWRGPYDLVVLPPGPTQAVPGKHLVQVNYLSAFGGGITLAQYRQIAGLPGVGVAAPLAIVGYVLETVRVPVRLSAASVGASGARVLAVSSQVTADRGLSKYPVQPSGYVYITPDRLSPLHYGPHPSVIAPYERVPGGTAVPVCGSNLDDISGGATPFARVIDTGLDICYSRATGYPGYAGEPKADLVGRPVVAGTKWSFPVLVAGIDPRAEDALTGLGGAVTSGRYLSETAGLATAPLKRGLGGYSVTVVPVLGSTTSFDGDSDRVTVRLLPSSAVTRARSGGDPLAIANALSAEPGRVGDGQRRHGLAEAACHPRRVGPQPLGGPPVLVGRGGQAEAGGRGVTCSLGHRQPDVGVAGRAGRQWPEVRVRAAGRGRYRVQEADRVHRAGPNCRRPGRCDPAVGWAVRPGTAAGVRRPRAGRATGELPCTDTARGGRGQHQGASR